MEFFLQHTSTTRDPAGRWLRDELARGVDAIRRARERVEHQVGVMIALYEVSPRTDGFGQVDAGRSLRRRLASGTDSHLHGRRFQHRRHRHAEDEGWSAAACEAGVPGFSVRSMPNRLQALTVWFDTASALPTTRSLSTTPVDMGGQYSKDKSIAGRDHDH
jgi:hypothetical protein